MKNVQIVILFDDLVNQDLLCLFRRMDLKAGLDEMGVLR